MKISIRYFILSILFIAKTLFAYNLSPSDRILTPKVEPHDDSFYVCYEKRYTPCPVRTFLYVYLKYRYLGCIISRKPCYEICLEKCLDKDIKLAGSKYLDKDMSVIKKHLPIEKDPHPQCLRTMQLFSWFNNYPDAINAFYRCAYSG